MFICPKSGCVIRTIYYQEFQDHITNDKHLYNRKEGLQDKRSDVTVIRELKEQKIFDNAEEDEELENIVDPTEFINSINYTNELAQYLENIFPDNFKNLKKRMIYPQRPDEGQDSNGDIMNAKPCIMCSQIIQFHQGLGIVVNMGKGKGGNVGSKHDCPKRVGTFMHPYLPYRESQIDMTRQCPTCQSIYNSRKIVICPACWQIECNKCRTQWTWKADSDQYITNEPTKPHFIPNTPTKDWKFFYKQAREGLGKFETRMNHVVNLVCPKCRSTDNDIIFAGKIKFEEK